QRTGSPRPAWASIRTRLGEVAIHTVDLDAGFEARHWPANFVDAYLPHICLGISNRVTAAGGGRWRVVPDDADGRWELGIGDHQGQINGPGWRLLAWLLGRADSDGLSFSGDAGTARRLPDAFPYGG